jgi:2-polyprenyl-3-methyl-5-hydroxy-6-metoxy-1,4-benzoquinol methylase
MGTGALTDNSDCYGYIPLDDASFCTALIDADNALGGPSTLLDVGCGIGNLLILADLLGWTASGIEIRPRYQIVARNRGLQVDVADARTYTGYGNFDCVYIQDILVDPAAETILETSIISQMKSGAVLILWGTTNMTTSGWTQVGDHCWVKP